MDNGLLDAVNRVLRATTNALVLTVGWVLLVLSAAIAFEVVARKLFRFSLQGVDEYGGYVLAVGATIGFAHAVYLKAHIRIDLALRLLSPPLRAVADAVALFALNIFAWTLFWRSVAVAWQSHSFHATAVSPLRTPLVLPQGVWALALGLFALVALVQFLRAVAAVRARAWTESAREFGITEIEEEVAREIAAAKRRLGTASEGGNDRHVGGPAP
jgi:TRAP-type C4-dicarboxylate transport system permease small subunit